MYSKNAPLRLTTANYWQQLEVTVERKELPAAAADLLKALIGCERNGWTTPTASSDLIKLSADHFSEGIMLSDSACDILYDIVVFVPDSENEEKCRRFFKLIPKYPHGEFKYPKYL